ncbi:metalloproteinase inhibitor 1-like [Pleurodeles waltl]|uniref:metalloproteinase inhibitor 1-like n=1 Tax=Pleurodeles waltl TaxID=8319 RepID=UPI0037099901
MDTRKWITVMAALLFVGVACPAEACRCIKDHLQRFYCNSNGVLKMRFIEPMQITDSGSQVTGYKIQLDEVLKGSAELQSLTFISSSAGTSCEYHHSESDYNVEYLVTAYNNSGDVSVSGCNYVVPWNELSSNQILGIQGAYSEGCTRNIISCFSPPCSPVQNTCVIEGDANPQTENQQKNQACVPNTNTTCSWKTIE